MRDYRGPKVISIFLMVPRSDWKVAKYFFALPTTCFVYNGVRCKEVKLRRPKIQGKRKMDRDSNELSHDGEISFKKNVLFAQVHSSSTKYLYRYNKTTLVIIFRTTTERN